MAYSRIKTWIAAEILTALDLNTEHTGHITNENDLDTKLTSEVNSRTTLESNVWDTDHIKTNKVIAVSIKDGEVSINKLAAAAVAQAKLKTSQGSVNENDENNLTLPGGEYGFYCRTKTEAGGEHDFHIASGVSNTSYATQIYIHHIGTGPAKNGYAQQRYVTASGEIHWVFILRDKTTKQITSMYQAPDHPCFGNGGKPLLAPHPFGNYNETKHEIIVINPSLEEIEQMELETMVDDETKPDKDLLEVITENYEIDENSNPVWPVMPVTVGLPKRIKDKKTGKKILVDYRFMSPDTIIEPIKKVIPKPDYIKVKKLKRK